MQEARCRPAAGSTCSTTQHDSTASARSSSWPLVSRPACAGRGVHGLTDPGDAEDVRARPELHFPQACRRNSISHNSHSASGAAEAVCGRLPGLGLALRLWRRRRLSGTLEVGVGHRHGRFGTGDGLAERRLPAEVGQSNVSRGRGGGRDCRTAHPQTPLAGQTRPGLDPRGT